MSEPIPIRNLYHLLLYALEIRPFVGSGYHSMETAPDVVNLFARLLGHQMRVLRDRGLESAYVDKNEELGLLRGKLDFTETNRRQSRLRSRVVCEFEDLSLNILPNQILKSTVERLLGREDLDAKSRSALGVHREMMKPVDVIPLKLHSFRPLVYHRNNRHYRRLMNLCRVIISHTMPTQEAGVLSFYGLDREQMVLHNLFEKFVRNFAKFYFPEATVGAPHIQWDGCGMDEESDTSLPRMETDLTIEWPQRKLILDCKFYRQALTVKNDTERARSAHLYQLYAYLRNQARFPGWESAAGILLYPAVNRDLDFVYRLSGHPIRITSVDLSKEWQVIEQTIRDVLITQPGEKRKLNVEKVRSVKIKSHPKHPPLWEVKIGGNWYSVGEKYTILETGWALYLSKSCDSSVASWIRMHGENCPTDGVVSSLLSSDSAFFTTHPVLVALALRIWWHANDKPMPMKNGIPIIPTFDEAVKEVRERKIANPWNAIHAGSVPGLKLWSGD